VLQYGVTRQRLSEVIRSGGGWDVVHLSGHGNRAGFTLERPDGSMDYASTADLVDLLRPSQARLKLAVLASCKSAAEAATDTLRLLGLPAQGTGPGTGSAPDYAAGHVGGLARGLAEELGCAVVATRYPVYDEFLTAFNQAFYERMLSGGEPAGMACARALAAVLAGASAGGPVSGGGSAVAVPEKAAPPGIPAATLGVFGASAAGLVLNAAPADPGPGGAGIVTAAERMAGFPHQAERFVGRDAIMTAASSALRAGSGTTAVLLHGMPGIGKTACALELAYLCQDQFSRATVSTALGYASAETATRNAPGGTAATMRPRRPAGPGRGWRPGPAVSRPRARWRAARRRPRPGGRPRSLTSRPGRPARPGRPSPARSGRARVPLCRSGAPGER
jgi:hypothetical protein